MKALGLTMGIAGTIIAIGSCNKVNSLDKQLSELYLEENPAIFQEYESIQFDLNSYIPDTKKLVEMDSAKAQKMIDEINASLDKKEKLKARRDSIAENFDIEEYKIQDAYRWDKINQKHSAHSNYMGVGILSAFFGLIGYMMVAKHYREEGRKRW